MIFLWHAFHNTARRKDETSHPPHLTSLSLSLSLSNEDKHPELRFLSCDMPGLSPKADSMTDYPRPLNIVAHTHLVRIHTAFIAFAEHAFSIGGIEIISG